MRPKMGPPSKPRAWVPHKTGPFRSIPHGFSKPRSGSASSRYAHPQKKSLQSASVAGPDKKIIYRFRHAGNQVRGAPHPRLCSSSTRPQMADLGVDTEIRPVQGPVRAGRSTRTRKKKKEKTGSGPVTYWFASVLDTVRLPVVAARAFFADGPPAPRRSLAFFGAQYSSMFNTLPE